MVHEASLFLLPSNRLVGEASGWRTDGTPHMGKRSPFALCNSLFWQQAAHSHRGDRSPLGAPPGCTAASRLFARLVVETVRRPVRIRVERTHNRFAAC